MNMAAVTPAGEQPRDDVLVASALAEPAAFSAIYERYWLAVYRYLRAQGADEDSAMDLTASTFERAISSLRGYRGHGGGLGAWLDVDRPERPGSTSTAGPRDRGPRGGRRSAASGRPTN